MLSRKDQKKIKSKFKKIYEFNYSKLEIEYYLKEIFQVIRKFNNKKNKKK